MANMANITIKKSDNTTDITWTAASPSAGDSVPAIWRSNSVSGIPAHRPLMSFLMRDNAAKNGRVFQMSVKYPHTWTEANTGRVFFLGNSVIRFEGTLPTGVTASELKEAFVQAGNLAVSSLIRTSLEDQYAPT